MNQFNVAAVGCENNNDNPVNLVRTSNAVHPTECLSDPSCPIMFLISVSYESMFSSDHQDHLSDFPIPQVF